MRRAAVAALLLLPLAAAPALAALDVSSFRYERSLHAPVAPSLVLRADALLLGHSRPDLADLRVLDADGEQVPWRTIEAEQPASLRSVRLLDVGREGRELVALLDLGPARQVHDRLTLTIPASRFVARVQVRGSDDRKTFRSLGGSLVYDLRGARHARSTTVLFRPSDLRYLELRATGVPSISAARVGRPAAAARVTAWQPRSQSRGESGRWTLVTLDLGYRLPVDELAILTGSGRFDRGVDVLGSLHGRSWRWLASGRVYRFPGARSRPLAIGSQTRFLRLRIFNGDDRPLSAVRLEALAQPTTLLVDGSRPRPYRLVYGSATAAAPVYDLQRLPRSALRLESARAATLGGERAVPAAVSERSFLDRHGWLPEAALALAALAIAGVGLLALRGRAHPAPDA